MVYHWHYPTPEGFSDMEMTGDGEVLTGLWFTGSRGAWKHTEPWTEAFLPVFAETSQWLDLYFRGQQPGFVPKFRIQNLTPFRQEVLEILQAIPHGETMTYGQIARQIEKKQGLPQMSAQAVGGAVGWNPVCILIPCHRVLGANGSLTGYGGGIENKIALLKLEGHDVSKFKLPK